MRLTANEKEIIKKQIEDMSSFDGGKSWYFQKEDVVIRVADHLPNFDNFEIYNENCTKIVLISCHVSEKEMINVIDENINNYEEIISIEIDGEDVTSENFDTLPDFKFL